MTTEHDLAILQANLRGEHKSAPVPPKQALRLTGLSIRGSTDEAKLNKTERAYLGYLRALGHPWIGIQNITLKLADDCRYTPDLSTLDVGGFTFWEVKGHMRDDAKVKLQVAARLFPWAKFVIVKAAGTGWEHIEVKP